MLLNRKISIAPMMEYTDKHFRYFLRLIAPSVLLYTEMVTTGALIHADYKRFLSFNSNEHPIALQLGGNNPKDLAYCAKLGEDFGYDEINLNVGCPSNRVKNGAFGASLMLNPDLVAECIESMSNAVTIPVTIKCRVGVDDLDSYADLFKFINITSSAGCNIFIIHARKAWLNGLSPKQNREIPPLQYDVVRKIKTDFPNLSLTINGGIKNILEVDDHLKFVDGVMIGREAYFNPYLLADINRKYYNTKEILSRHEVVENFLPYIEENLKYTKLSNITRHILSLFHGLPGAKKWRRHLSENVHKTDCGIKLVKEALMFV
ncbi:tRNA dihydrouridine(20/20a) synthase DusA [Gammaproteobacteria bacterium]|nr:tRNA dihydrouridine(20/20a) synthase DusA [Gammaproteobacteria bacterium]